VSAPVIIIKGVYRRFGNPTYAWYAARPARNGAAYERSIGVLVVTEAQHVFNIINFTGHELRLKRQPVPASV